MDKENLENFFDSEDGVIKEFNGKIRFCIVILIFFVIYLTLYLLNKITIGSFAFAGISASIPVMLLIILNKFKHKEARDNFYAGYCILTLSVMSWYSAINSERDFRKTQQKTPNNIENSLQMIA